MEKIKTVSACRLCDSTDISEILNFGNVALANNYRDSADTTGEFTAPLRVFQCSCGSIQLFDEVNSDVLFGNGYNYASPPNLQKHFEEYALTTTEKVLDIEKSDLIVGIGGNNGLLEIEYKKLGFENIVNIEPAQNIAKLSEGNGIETINEFFTPNLATRIYKYDYRKAKLITCNNCFAHIPDLNEIVEGIKVLLDPRGYFVFENAYWLNTILGFDAFQVYSEHIYYHSIKPLVKFFIKHGLELFDVSLNGIQLGSFRCFVGWPGAHEISSSVNNLIKLETDFGLYRASTYQKFNRDVEYEKVKFLSRIDARNHKKIALYGVPAKIVLLIKLWGLENYIDYAIDSSPIKHKKYIPGTKIKIHPVEFWEKDEPSATIVGAYNFFEDVAKKHPNYKNWIVPFS